jgi:hypothetical protein
MAHEMFDDLEDLIIEVDLNLFFANERLDDMQEDLDDLKAEIAEITNELVLALRRAAATVVES